MSRLEIRLADEPERHVGGMTDIDAPAPENASAPPNGKPAFLQAVLEDVKRRGHVAFLKDAAARDAAWNAADWKERRAEIIEAAEAAGVPVDHGLAAFGLPSEAGPTRKGRGRRPLAKTELVPIASLVRDPEINCRAGGVNEKLATEYAEALDAGARFPPVVSFRDAEGKLWLADGWHRGRAHEIVGNAEIAIDVQEGDRRAALLYAASANAIHGARRTNADKRRAVLALLADAEWREKSHRWIAEQCSVNHELVATLRKQAGDSASSPREGKDGKIRRSPRGSKRTGFRRVPAVYKVATKALGRLNEAWAKRKPIDALLAEVRRALDELERRAPETTPETE